MPAEIRTKGSNILAVVTVLESVHSLELRNTVVAEVPGQGGDDLRSNAIIAGAVETNIGQSMDRTKVDMGGTQRWQVYYGVIPGQLKAMDIANLALFLASDESIFKTMLRSRLHKHFAQVLPVASLT